MNFLYVGSKSTSLTPSRTKIPYNCTPVVTRASITLTLKHTSYLPVLMASSWDNPTQLKSYFTLIPRPTTWSACYNVTLMNLASRTNQKIPCTLFPSCSNNTHLGFIHQALYLHTPRDRFRINMSTFLRAISFNGTTKHTWKFCNYFLKYFCFE